MDREEVPLSPSDNNPMETGESSRNVPDYTVILGDWQYTQALNLNVSNFLSVKLSGTHNYRIWQAQMLSLLESQQMRGMVDSNFAYWAGFESDTICQLYNSLLRCWIYNSIKEEVFEDIDGYEYAFDIWNRLLEKYGTSTEIEEMMENTSNAVDDPIQLDDLKYMRASNINVSSFVSVKLSGHENYHIWRTQISCLMESQNMYGMVVSGFNKPETKNDRIIKLYENLLIGWIFSSLTEEVLNHVNLNESHPHVVWKDLKTLYDHPKRKPKGSESPEVLYDKRKLEIRKAEVEADNNNIQPQTDLRNITLEGRWWKAESILKKHKKAAMEAIDSNGNTILHIAVAEGNNYFIKKLLNFIQNGEEIEKINSEGYTALHVAAKVGNKYAAELLVKKREKLLEIERYSKGIPSTTKDLDELPLHTAYYSSQINTYLYLFDKATENRQEYTPPYLAPFENLLSYAIRRKQYDLASELATKYPELAKRNGEAMMAITLNFPSEIGFGEALIYPSFNDACQKIVKRRYLLFSSSKFVYTRAEDILWAMRSCENTYCMSFLPEIVMILLPVPLIVLYPVYQLIRLLISVLLFPFFLLYFLLWKVMAVVVFPIKHIENQKEDLKEAKKVLEVICNQIEKSEFSDPDYEIYTLPILEATRVDAVEVVCQILHRSPETVNYRNEKNQNIIQIAIINRSEKVYHLSCRMMEHNLYFRKMKEDSSQDNLLHLVGRLAPSIVLSRSTGAALQLQRELQWREEIRKLMSPTQLTAKNANDETPEMVFTREHADLVKEGETWMKTTAESCSITAALIVTIVFAAAITVPGGNNQDTGIPVFKNKAPFVVFAVSDAISLFTAATSLLVFLSILTARFAENDFLISLPRRLIIGLCFLFLSTTAMIVAFCAILFLVFCDNKPWMLAPIGTLACLPIAAVVTLQLPLVIDLYRSTLACLPIAAVVTLQLPLVIDLYRSTYSPLFGEKQKERYTAFKED